MKKLSLILVAGIVAILASCRGGENKADNDVDTYNNERSGEEKIQDVSAPSTTTTKPATIDSTVINPGNNEILAKIDQYLVSKPNYPAGGTGIKNAVVTIKNTLPNITFQKAIIQVDMLSADGKVLRNDFYPIQNIEPGDVETIKIPDLANAASIRSHVVKIKSDALTNGEMVLVGSQQAPGQ